MNEWILLAIVVVWIPVSVCAMSVILFPGKVEQFWNAQNQKEEDENHDLFI